MSGNPGAHATITISREELYALIWAAPLKKVAEQLGTTGTELSRLWGQHNIARPDNGHWTRVELGMPVKVHALEPARSGIPDCIEIVRKPPRPPKALASETDAQVKPEKAPGIGERVTRPHPLVAEWIAIREKEVRARDTVYDHRLKRLVTPVPLTPADRRRLLVADAIFKAVEARGVTVRKGERFALLMLQGAEQIEFQLRYRMKRGKRPLDARELRWREPGAQDWRYELYETDSLVFEIKTWMPGGRPEWEDSRQGRIEERLGEVVDGILAAFPALEAVRRQREDDKRRHQEAERERYRREEERRLDKARFRKLLELAGNWREAEAARAFLAVLRDALPIDGEAVGGVETVEWLAWAERRIEAHDRLAGDPRSVLEEIASVTGGTYRD
ncbi:hypothetical protein [Sphingomonas alpina]|uniref:Uncharacterized protein n=1 Tax=Sphingomonas alpina TaxID=653931 RepID=A0A7H0LIY4_9SPHN|nr:hypothetical protein [Sphingomonas alpina]QNQ09637.1 hypothetical protein H3Z74_23955 [Sphingomonas alpina]